MEVISSIYNSGHNIKKFYLGSRELNLAYLGNQVIYDEVIGDNDLNYILYEFYGSDTLPNTVEAPVKRAILKGNTGYRDIDTGEFLETFEKGRNLELVSVKMPVLTTSNEDGTKTNILTVNEDVELRGSGEVKDELDLLTGELTQRIGEVVLDGSEDWQIDSDTNDYRLALALKHNGEMLKYSQSICDKYPTTTGKQSETATNYIYIGSTSINVYENPSMTLEEFKSKLKQNPMTFQYQFTTESVKTVDLTMVDQDEQTISKLNSFNGTTHVSTEVAENSIYPTIAIEVATE